MSEAFVNPLARNLMGVANKARTIKQWTRAFLALPDDAVVSVNELACHLPDCSPKETVLLLMWDGRTIKVSIHKAMQELTEADIFEALRTCDFSCK